LARGVHVPKPFTHIYTFINAILPIVDYIPDCRKIIHKVYTTGYANKGLAAEMTEEEEKEFVAEVKKLVEQNKEIEVALSKL